MSGPITAGYVIVHGVLVLSARALKEARAMKCEYGQVLARLRERESQQAQARQGQQAARLERIAAVRSEVGRQTARYERLRSLAQAAAAHAPDIGAKIPASMPAPPMGGDDVEWGTHLRTLGAAVGALESLLAATSGAFGDEVRASLAAASEARTIDEVLASYLLQRQMKPGLDSAQAERLRQTAARVLARLDLAQGELLPTDLEDLAKAILLAPTYEHAETLATELRLAVQRHREAREAQRNDAGEAGRLIEQLPADAPELLVHALELVAARVERMDPALREATKSLLAAAALDRDRHEQEAAALVLQESLRDLGYEVEDIEATLFADGGAVHFRRQGWENYFVRLRVDPREHTVNFNVVRARGDEDTAERRRLDALAEDRWCAEFPRLMRTLAARGLALDVTRRLDAGAVPVQVVDGAQLPRIVADEESARPRAAPLARDRT